MSGRKEVRQCLKMAAERGMKEMRCLTDVKKQDEIGVCETVASDTEKICNNGGVDEVILVKDALSAMDEIAKEKPVMIFFEMFLPGVSGVNFLNEIVMDERMIGVPLVMLADNEIEIMGIEEYGVVRILNLEKVKPIEIMRIVKRYAGRGE